MPDVVVECLSKSERITVFRTAAADQAGEQQAQFGAGLRYRENGKRQSRAHQKFGACTNTLISLFARCDCAGPNQRRASMFANHMADHRNRVRNRHGDFEYWNAAGTDGFDSPGCVLDRCGPHYRHNANLSDPADHVLNGHNGSLIQRSARPSLSAAVLSARFARFVRTSPSTLLRA